MKRHHLSIIDWLNGENSVATVSYFWMCIYFLWFFPLLDFSNFIDFFSILCNVYMPLCDGNGFETMLMSFWKSGRTWRHWIKIALTKPSSDIQWNLIALHINGQKTNCVSKLKRNLIVYRSKKKKPFDFFILQPKTRYQYCRSRRRRHLVILNICANYLTQFT